MQQFALGLGQRRAIGWHALVRIARSDPPQEFTRRRITGNDGTKAAGGGATGAFGPMQVQLSAYAHAAVALQATLGDQSAGTFGQRQRSVRSSAAQDHGERSQHGEMVARAFGVPRGNTHEDQDGSRSCPISRWNDWRVP